MTSLDPTTGQIWWREQLRTPGDQAVSTPVYSNHRLLIAGLMLKLDADKPAASDLLEPTSPFGDRKCAWTPPAYANRHVFARNDAELVCASLAAKP